MHMHAHFFNKLTTESTLKKDNLVFHFGKLAFKKLIKNIIITCCFPVFHDSRSKVVCVSIYIQKSKIWGTFL